MRYIGRFFIVLYVPECPVGTLGRLPATVNGAAKRRSALILKGLSCGLLSKILNKLRNYTSLIFLVPFTFLQLLKKNKRNFRTQISISFTIFGAKIHNFE